MKKDAITFENGNRAVVITAPRDANAQAILDALQIASPRAVILLFGGAAGLDDSRKAALATLFAGGVAPVAAELGARLGAQLKEELSGHPMVGDIRGAGMFWGLELVRDRATRTPYEPGLRVTNRVLAAALRRDLFIYPSIGMAGKAGGDALMVTPPFVIEESDIDYIVRNLSSALDEVHRGLS